MDRFNVFLIISVIGVFVSLTLMPVTARDMAYDFSFSLPTPVPDEEKTYLGVKGEDPFRLEQIDAKVILIQIFSMYCPICQREADHVNQVVEKFRTDPALNGNIRMIGIGAGNSDFEVQFYKSNYKIAFPVFSDADFTIHKMVKEVGTPHFFGLKRMKNNSLKLIFSHSGPIPDPQKFVNDLTRALKAEATP